MKDKFSYFDFICNIIIGTLPLWTLISFINYMPTKINLNTNNIITDSFLFLILSYLTGHILQAISKRTTEPKLKKKYWDGSFPSDLYLIKGNKLCSEIKRKKIINLLKNKFGFTDSDIEVLNYETVSEEAKEQSTFFSLLCFTFISDKGIGEKANIQMIFYTFFRGLVVSCLISSIIYSILFLYQLGTKFVNWPAKISSVDFALLSALALAILLFIFRKIFMERARQRAEYYISEVFNSLIGYFISIDIKK